MSAKSFMDGFGKSEAQIEPFNYFPDISDDVAQTLARILGFNDQLKEFKFLRLDQDGRLYVSTSPTQTNEAVNGNADVTTSSVLLLSANPNRRQYILVNTGTDTVYITFGATATTANGIPLIQGAFYSDDVYTGALSGITVAGTSNVRIAEF